MNAVRSACRRPVVLLGLTALAAVSWTGCSSTEPKPMAQPSVQDVRGNADRAFEKLKQEEKQRENRSAPSGY